MFEFKIVIANKVIQFKCNDPRLSYDVSEEKEFACFVYSGPRKPDIVLDIKYGVMPDFGKKEVMFSVDNSWSVSKCGDRMLFEYFDRNLESRIERAADVDADMKEGTIYVNRDKTPEEEEESKRQRLLKMTPEEKERQDARAARNRDRTERGHAAGTSTITQTQPVVVAVPKTKSAGELGRKVMSEVKANFFQAFIVEYVVKQRLGFLVHCSSVYHDNKLNLFMGQSRAGKSTIAGLWHDAAGATVFNDDRAVITARNGGAYFYNAPWAGTLFAKCKLKEGNDTRINRIFFIYQHTDNVLRRLAKVEASARIFRNSFPVFWERKDLGYVIDQCSGISASAACYELGFVNNDSAVSFLKKELKEEAK